MKIRLTVLNIHLRKYIQENKNFKTTIIVFARAVKPSGVECTPPDPKFGVHYCQGDPYPVGTDSGKLQCLLVTDSATVVVPFFGLECLTQGKWTLGPKEESKLVRKLQAQK